MATFLRLVRRLQGDTPASTTAFPPKGGLWISCSNKKQQANKRAFLRADCPGSPKTLSVTQHAATGGADYESESLTVFSLRNQLRPGLGP